MKIGLDAYVLKFPFTGIGVYTSELARGLNQLEDLHLFIDSIQNLNSEWKNYKYIELIRKDYLFNSKFLNRIQDILTRRIFLNIYKNKNHYLSFFDKLPISFEELNIELDVYHSVDWYFRKYEKARKNILTIFDLTTELFPHFHDRINIDKDKIKREKINSFDSIISISENTKKDLIHIWKVDPKKITSIPLSANSLFDSYTYIPKKEIFDKYDIPEDSNYFLTVSTIEPRKNFKTVLECFQLFKDKYPKEKVFLLATGLWGWKNKELKDYLRNYKYIDSIKFTGYVELSDLPSIYHYSSAFMYLSLYEGFGIPVLEAMKSKTFVIASNNSSIPEITLDTAYLVDPINREEILSGMIEGYFSETQKTLYIEKAFKRGKDFSWSKTIQKTIEVYKK